MTVNNKTGKAIKKNNQASRLESAGFTYSNVFFHSIIFSLCKFTHFQKSLFRDLMEALCKLMECVV